MNVDEPALVYRVERRSFDRLRNGRIHEISYWIAAMPGLLGSDSRYGFVPWRTRTMLLAGPSALAEPSSMPPTHAHRLAACVSAA